MRVFLTGVTGYIGTAVAEALRAAGHDVHGLVRSESAAARAKDAGVIPVHGDLATMGVLKEASAAADAVIHVAQSPSGDVDAAAVRAILDGLAGSGKAFVYTSGCWVYGATQGRCVDEDAPLNPTPLVSWRPGVERVVLDAKGVRGVVLRPGIVYGRGQGIPRMFAQSAKETGFARVIGSGEDRWVMVHVDDLAALYVLALDRAPAGSVFNAVHGPSVRVLDIATSLSRAAGSGKVKLWPLEEARQTLGAFADALVLDQMASSARAERELGWGPKAPSALVELQKPLA